MQATLSVVLLVGAGLFLRSMQRVNAVDLGMQADRVLTVELRYPRLARDAGESFSDWLARGSELERMRYRRLVDVARRLPGVERAAVTVTIPLSGGVRRGRRHSSERFEGRAVDAVLRTGWPGAGFSGSWLIIRPRGEVTTAWPALREALQAADPEVRSIDVRQLSQGLAGEVRPFRLGMVAFGLSATLALIVAGLGLYSIMAHAVAWRRHEIGVRLALGARPRSIARLVVGRGALLATAGIGLGLTIALAARPWIEPQLFNTSARDPLVLLGVAVVLEAVALAAGWIPARRAVAVSPTEALRAE